MTSRGRILLIAAVSTLTILTAGRAAAIAPDHHAHVREVLRFLQAARWCMTEFRPGPLRARCITEAFYQRGPYYEYGPGAPTPTSTPTPTPTSTSTPTATDTPSVCSGKPDGATCDAGFDWGTTLVCIDGDCVPCSPDGNGVSTRFVDNGDGTITDLKTCLVWEKKDNAGGIHDQDNRYVWSTCGSFSCVPDGSVFTEFIGGLNAMGFAGHGDWRLPTSAGDLPSYPTGEAPQLESLFDASAPGCGVAHVACVPPLFDANCGPFDAPNDGCTIDGANGTQECSCTKYGVNVFYVSFSTIPYSSGGYLLYVAGMNYLGGPEAVGINASYQWMARAVRGGVVFVP